MQPPRTVQFQMIVGFVEKMKPAFPCDVCVFAGMEFHDLLDIPQGDRRKYHDDVSVMVVSLEGRIWRSSGQYYPERKPKSSR